MVCDHKKGGAVKKLRTRHGTITFPAFMPVTTFGDRFPLDGMVRPYLKRMSQCLMVSHYYAREMKKRPDMPIFIDSGGFAGLFSGAEIVDRGEYACIRTTEGKELDPMDVLRFQILNADIGATLDLIIPPGMPEDECERRQNLTIKNALFARKRNITGDLILFASLQCWDEWSARRCAGVYAKAGFDGIAIGGMVPRAKDREYIRKIVRAVRAEAPDCLIHVFGCGNMELIPDLIEAGADSFDSSSYARSAVDAGNIFSRLYAAVEHVQEMNSLMGKTGYDCPIDSNMELILGCR